MLNTLSSASDPAVYQSQRRGVITGGAFHARTAINETNLTGFVPPGFNAGCGGIDLYGGSFSFINSEQFNKLIRDIAGNASGYLLGLAISAMNEKAYQHIEALQEKILHLNSLFSSSCQMGQGLVNSLPMPAAMKKFQTDASLTISRANVADTFQAFTGTGLANRDPVQAWSQSSSEQDKQQLTGNLIWNALKKSSAISSPDFREAVMSLTGTVIIAMNTEGRPIIFPYVGNQLKVEDLIYGNPKARVYRCRDRDPCLSLSLQDNQSITGLSEQLIQLLNAVADHWDQNSDGALSTTTFSARPLDVLKSLPNGTGGMIRNLTTADVQLAKQFIARAAPHIAFFMMHQFVEDLHQAVQALVTMEGDRHPFSEQLQATLGRSRQQLRDELNHLGQRYGRWGELVSDYRQLLAVAQQERYQHSQYEAQKYHRYRSSPQP